MSNILKFLINKFKFLTRSLKSIVNFLYTIIDFIRFTLANFLKLVLEFVIEVLKFSLCFFLLNKYLLGYYIYFFEYVSSSELYIKISAIIFILIFIYLIKWLYKKFKGSLVFIAVRYKVLFYYALWWPIIYNYLVVWEYFINLPDNIQVWVAGIIIPVIMIILYWLWNFFKSNYNNASPDNKIFLYLNLVDLFIFLWLIFEWKLIYFDPLLIKPLVVYIFLVYPLILLLRKLWEVLVIDFSSTPYKPLNFIVKFYWENIGDKKRLIVITFIKKSYKIFFKKPKLIIFLEKGVDFICFILVKFLEFVLNFIIELLKFSLCLFLLYKYLLTYYVDLFEYITYNEVYIWVPLVIIFSLIFIYFIKWFYKKFKKNLPFIPVRYKVLLYYAIWGPILFNYIVAWDYFIELSDDTQFWVGGILIFVIIFILKWLWGFFKFNYNNASPDNKIFLYFNLADLITFFWVVWVRNLFYWESILIKVLVTCIFLLPPLFLLLKKLWELLVIDFTSRPYNPLTLTVQIYWENIGSKVRVLIITFIGKIYKLYFKRLTSYFKKWFYFIYLVLLGLLKFVLKLVIKTLIFCLCAFLIKKYLLIYYVHFFKYITLSELYIRIPLAFIFIPIFVYFIKWFYKKFKEDIALIPVYYKVLFYYFIWGPILHTYIRFWNFFNNLPDYAQIWVENILTPVIMIISYWLWRFFKLNYNNASPTNKIFLYFNLIDLIILLKLIWGINIINLDSFLVKLLITCIFFIFPLFFLLKKLWELWVIDISFRLPPPLSFKVWFYWKNRKKPTGFTTRILVVSFMKKVYYKSFN